MGMTTNTFQEKMALLEKEVAALRAEQKKTLREKFRTESKILFIDPRLISFSWRQGGDSDDFPSWELITFCLEVDGEEFEFEDFQEEDLACMKDDDSGLVQTCQNVFTYLNTFCNSDLTLLFGDDWIVTVTAEGYEREEP